MRHRHELYARSSPGAGPSGQGTLREGGLEEVGFRALPGNGGFDFFCFLIQPVSAINAFLKIRIFKMKKKNILGCQVCLEVQ